MDDALKSHTFLMGDAISLADICLFAYTHVAEEGGAYQLSGFPNVQRWITTIESQDWCIPITQG
jgi:glutathione S-transferase